MKKFVLVVVALLAFAGAAQAQTVPGPRVSLAFDQPQLPSCESPTVMNAWNFTYGSCYLPAGVTLGSPFLTHVRVTFAGTATVSSLIPRAQVTLETTATRCGGGTVPCLRISDLTAPSGASMVTARFVDGEGRDGGPSTAIPFSGSQPLVPAGVGLRVIPNP